MAKYEVTQEHEKCIACGTCVVVCPDNWQQSDDGKYKPIKTKVNEVGCNKEAEENCPVSIIHVKEI